MTSKRGIAGRLLSGARSRARSDGIAFNLTVDDIVVPEFCPVLGIELIPGKGKVHDNSPTLDRIIPAEGYVWGNVVVVSARANRLKSNATISELRRIASYYEQIS